VNTNLRKTFGQITVALSTMLALAALTPRAFAQGGIPLWTNFYNGADYSSVTALAVDGSGNVVVTGSSSWNTSGWSYATIKYSGAGVPLWTNRYEGPANSDYTTAVTVDGGGNVFVAGRSYGGGGFNYDFATIKYSSAGMALWTNRYNGLGNGEDTPRAIAVDSSGKVFVTGGSWSGSHYDYATLAYSSTGVPLWTNRYNDQAFPAA